MKVPNNDKPLVTHCHSLQLGSPPSSQLMPSWLIDAETWYEDQDADMSKIPKIERKINNLETQVQKEQDRYKKMLSVRRVVG